MRFWKSILWLLLLVLMSGFVLSTAEAGRLARIRARFGRGSCSGTACAPATQCGPNGCSPRKLADPAKPPAEPKTVVVQPFNEALQPLSPAK